MKSEAIVGQKVTGIRTAKLSTIARAEIEWRWPLRFPCSSITNITGDPGVGKGILMAHVVAKFTSGGLLPGMSVPTAPSNALILAEEDDAGMVLRPRLEDMGANLDRVHIYTGYTNKDGKSVQFDISKIDELQTKIRELQIDFVLFDPLLDFFGLTEINKAEKVKAMLSPLHNLAKTLKVSIACVIHCNKGDVKALYKGSGSIQFAGKARSVFFIEKSPENPEEKVLCHVKSNLGPAAPSLVYRIEHLNGDPNKPILVWKHEDEGKWTADDLLGETSQLRTSKEDVAKAIIRGRLSVGPCLSTDLDSLRDEFAISSRTFKRARESLQVKAIQKVGPDGKSHWVTFLENQDAHSYDLWHSGPQGQNSTTGLEEKINNLEKTFNNFIRTFGTLGSGTLGVSEGQGANLLETREPTPVPQWLLRDEVEQGIAYVKSIPPLERVLADAGSVCQTEISSWIEHLTLPWLKSAGAEEALTGLEPPATMRACLN
jgi:AAA domain